MKKNLPFRNRLKYTQIINLWMKGFFLVLLLHRGVFFSQIYIEGNATIFTVENNSHHNNSSSKKFLNDDSIHIEGGALVYSEKKSTKSIQKQEVKTIIKKKIAKAEKKNIKKKKSYLVSTPSFNFKLPDSESKSTFFFTNKNNSYVIIVKHNFNHLILETKNVNLEIDQFCIKQKKCYQNNDYYFKLSEHLFVRPPPFFV